MENIKSMLKKISAKNRRYQNRSSVISSSALDAELYCQNQKFTKEMIEDKIIQLPRPGVKKTFGDEI